MAAVPMILSDAIVRVIREAAENYELNVSNISFQNREVRWTSQCGGAIGSMLFRVPLYRFEAVLDKAIQDVSTLISFATLTLKEENRGLAENIKRGEHEGSPHYFRIIQDTNRVKVYIGLPMSHGYRAFEVEYTCDKDTGEYTWNIPDEEELFATLREETPLMEAMRRSVDGGTAREWGGEDPGDMELEFRGISAYTVLGLGATQSEGIPTQQASDAIREYSGYTEDLQNGATDYYVEHE